MSIVHVYNDLKKYKKEIGLLLEDTLHLHILNIRTIYLKHIIKYNLTVSKLLLVYW